MLGFMLASILFGLLFFQTASTDFAKDTYSATLPVALVAKKDVGNTPSLENNQIQLEEDGKQIRFETRKRADSEPFVWILVLDASNSQRDQFERQRQAAIAIVNTVVRDSDKVIAIAFDTNIQTSGKDGTKPEAIKLLQEAHAGGGTAVFDALYFAALESRRLSTGPGGSALLVFSDGDDNQSRVSLEEAITKLQAVDVACFPLLDSRPPQLSIGLRVLEQVSEKTGGRILGFRNTSDAAALIAAWEPILRQRLLLTYAIPSPLQADPKRKPKHHEIKIRTDRKDFAVFHRKHRIE